MWIKLLFHYLATITFCQKWCFKVTDPGGRGNFPPSVMLEKMWKNIIFECESKKKVINLKDGNFLSCLSKKKSPKIVIILEPFPPNGAVDPLLAFNYVENMSPNYYKSENNIIWSSCIEIRVPVFSFWLSFSFCLIVIAS